MFTLFIGGPICSYDDDTCIASTMFTLFIGRPICRRGYIFCYVYIIHRLTHMQIRIYFLLCLHYSHAYSYVVMMMIILCYVYNADRMAHM